MTSTRTVDLADYWLAVKQAGLEPVAGTELLGWFEVYLANGDEWVVWQETEGIVRFDTFETVKNHGRRSNYMSDEMFEQVDCALHGCGIGGDIFNSWGGGPKERRRMTPADLPSMGSRPPVAPIVEAPVYVY